MPRRKVKHIRRGASVTLYLDFELLADIKRIADRDDMNFNDTVRELLYAATTALREE